MAQDPAAHHAQRCSFQPDRQDPYLRLNTVRVFVHDQDRSLKFYVDQLGFALAFDTRLPSGERWLAVTPPDGTAMLELVAPPAGSEDSRLIGRATQIVFLTENIFAKCDEWRQRGVCIIRPPAPRPGGGMAAAFEDADRNSFTILALDEMTREVEAQRRAHAEKQQADRHAAHELEIAKRAQAGLFPQVLPPLRTLDYAGACFQARHVGGDYYDFLDLGRQRLGLVIGDVSGKGTAAALLMANLQAHLRELSAAYWNRPFTPFALEQPERLLRTLNRLFCENTADGAFATLFFAEYDDQTRQLRYASCGHPSALLLGCDGCIHRLDSTCAVLGLTNGWDCAVAEHHLQPGETLVLYTDGVTESFNEADEEFGEDRLIEALKRRRELPPQEMVGSLAQAVREFNPHHQHDDITLVVARARPD